MKIELTQRELGTILAALRYWQSDLAVIGKPYLFNIATNDGEYAELDELEIDRLCQNINVGRLTYEAS